MIFKKKTDLPKITLKNGADVISELEKSHRDAERALDAAGMTLREARERYEASLDEGREAALVARQAVTTAEVDLEIARRGADTLSERLNAARAALEHAVIEQKRAEAERLRAVFEAAVQQGLARMGVEARAILRAWAEAELAIEDVRRTLGQDGESIPGAEDFRNIPAVGEREISRERVVLWLRPGTNEPYPDEVQKRIVRQDRGAYLPPARAGFAFQGQGQYIADAGEFERITYASHQMGVRTPSLVKSFCIPAMIAGGTPGWLPDERFTSPRAVLARLTELEVEKTKAQKEPELKVVQNFIRLVAAK